MENMEDDNNPNPDHRDERPVQINRNYREQRYRVEWEQNPEFRNWLQAVPDTPNRAQCTLCNSTFRASLYAIREHRETAKHRRNENRRYDNNRPPDDDREEILNRKVNRAKIKLCAMFAEHNLAFLLGDHLIPILKDICFDIDCREIWERLNLNRLSIQKIIKECIAKSYKMELIEKLRVTKFSIQFDETTDVSQIHNACIVIKYLDFDLRKVVCAVWEILPVLDEYGDNHGAGANELFEKIISSFSRENIPLQNIISFGSDGCSVMMGARNSVVQRFRQMNPNVVIVKCPSHSIHLCAENAMKQLPSDIVKFCSSIHNFFSRSPKRQHALTEFQVFLDMEIHKILRPSSTRWLSLEASVSRIIEQWNALQLYFTHAFLQENIGSAGPILDFLNSKANKCYMLFLNFILPKVNTVNKFFQRNDIIIHKISKVLNLFFKQMCSLFLQQPYVHANNASDIDPQNAQQILDLNLINLGNEANTFLNNNDTPDFDEIQKRNLKQACLQFLQQLRMQIKARFNNLQNNYFDYLGCIAPENALSQNFHINNVDCMQNVIQYFSGLLNNQNDIHSIINEWNEITLYDFPDYLTQNPEISAFWFEIYFFQNETHEFPLRNLAHFILNILVVPHSNVEPERVWSKVKLEKTPLRNKLHLDTVNALLLSSQCIKQTGDCRNFEPTELMFELISNLKVTSPTRYR